MDKFEKAVKPGGTLIYDPNGITKHPTRKDISIYQVAATDKATQMGNTKVFNMIVLGGYLKIKPIVEVDNVMKGLEKSLPKRHHNLLPENKEAIMIGMELIQKC